VVTRAGVPAASPTEARSARSTWLSFVAVLGGAAAALSVWLAFESDHVDQPGIQAALMGWVVLGYVLAGVVATARSLGPFGPLMIAAGFGIALSSLSWSNGAVLFTIGIMFDLVAGAVFLHVILAFPTGHLRSRLEVGLVVVAYFTAFALQIVGLLLGGFGDDNALNVTDDADAATDLLHAQLVVLAAVSLISFVILLARRRTASRKLARSLALVIDSFSLVLVMLAFLFLAGAFGFVEGGDTFETIRRATFVALGLAPLVFLVGVLNARLRQASVGDLLLELRAYPAPGELRPALARALRDPSLELAYWLPDFESYADLDGRPVVLPRHDPQRAVTEVDRDGAPVAVLLHDPSLLDEPELLDAVAATAGIALENARLQSDLRARVDELAESRARLLHAEQTERQRLERNLHDGAQQRLVALSLDLGRLEYELAPEDSGARERLGDARRQVTASLEELRDVARGLHPAVVSAHGLPVALEELTARAAVPVNLVVDVHERPLETVEVAAYYVVSESLANIGKHARATSASVTVTRDGDRIVVEVLDDGVGGADTEQGSGLRGLADRVEALGGRLRVWTPPGGGTRVLAEFSCGS
jgi:signal transduction histidine kinase